MESSTNDATSIPLDETIQRHNKIIHISLNNLSSTLKNDDKQYYKRTTNQPVQNSINVVRLSKNKIQVANNNLINHRYNIKRNEIIEKTPSPLHFSPNKTMHNTQMDDKKRKFFHTVKHISVTPIRKNKAFPSSNNISNNFSDTMMTVRSSQNQINSSNGSEDYPEPEFRDSISIESVNVRQLPSPHRSSNVGLLSVSCLNA